MILTRDRNHGDYEIHSYMPGALLVNETTYDRSLLIGAHDLKLWTPQTFQELSEDSFEPVFPLHPDIVLLGTGADLIFPPSRIFREFYDKKIGIDVMTTIAACRTFNVLMSEGRNVVAALLIR